MDQSSRSLEDNIAQVVSATSMESFLVATAMKRQTTVFYLFLLIPQSAK